MAEGTVAVAHVNQETVLAGRIAGAQILVHEEGFSGAGGAQQEQVIVLDEPVFEGFFLNVEAFGNKQDTVAHFQHSVGNAFVRSFIDVQAQG